MRLLALALLSVALAGCSTTGKDGTKHYFVLGFGIVSVNATNPSSAQVYKMQVLGLGVSDMPGVRVSAGYANSTVVCVPETNSAVLEISDAPLKPLTIR